MVWQVVRTSGVESRFEALHVTGLNVLVGRDEEFELLLRCWQRAKSGEGQVVLLSGEAGIGKSRLAAALLENLATEPHARLRYFCSSQHTNSALYPIIAQMERAAGLAQGDTPQARLDKLDAVLAQTSTSIEDAALFAEMLFAAQRWALSRARSDSRATPATNAERIRFTSTSPDTLQSTADNLRGCALGRPHQPGSPQSGGGPDRGASRPADRDVPAGIRSALDWTASCDCPSDQSTGTARCCCHSRSPCRQKEATGRCDGGDCGAYRRQSAVCRRRIDEDGTGGGERGRKPRVVTAVPSPGLAVPGSLHASLMARLDRLGFAKELAQIGATIGREFSHALLAALVRKSQRRD